jgi:hypothetical protein
MPINIHERENGTVETVEHVAADNWPPVAESEHERVPGLPPSLVPHVLAIVNALTRAQQALRAGQVETTRKSVDIAIDAARLLQEAGR